MKYVNDSQRIVAVDEVGEEVGEITFAVESNLVWVANRTFVDNRFRGQGIAQELMKRLVERARAEGAKIIPTCSFVVKEFERVPEYQDVQK